MSGYNYSLTTFSPSGKLVQIEYALNAVGQGVTSVGVKGLLIAWPPHSCSLRLWLPHTAPATGQHSVRHAAANALPAMHRLHIGTNGSVIVTERKIPNCLTDGETMERIAVICDNIGLVYSGMGPDARVLVAKARKSAQAYRNTYGEFPSVYMLVRDLAAVMQEYTQSGGVRPFGVSLLVAGVDETGASLYQVDPSGASWAWKASAIGKNMVNAKSFLERRYADDLEIEDAVHTALLTLKEGFEGQMSKDNVEIGIAYGPNSGGAGFKMLTPDEIQDYIANI